MQVAASPNGKPHDMFTGRKKCATIPQSATIFSLLEVSNNLYDARCSKIKGVPLTVTEEMKW